MLTPYLLKIPVTALATQAMTSSMMPFWKRPKRARAIIEYRITIFSFIVCTSCRPKVNSLYGSNTESQNACHGFTFAIRESPIKMMNANMKMRGRILSTAMMAMVSQSSAFCIPISWKNCSQSKPADAPPASKRGLVGAGSPKGDPARNSNVNPHVCTQVLLGVACMIEN